ncbi:carbohydrate binding domain-containing protein [Candidatus Microgenomates bacterium]|nr:carbohydrate binding domain-containing protein [Candidatus Microgenomates bacterium]
MTFLPKVILVFFVLLFFDAGDALAVENFDFDDGLDGWTKNVSTLMAEATDSAALLKSSSTSTKYLYQIVPASPSATYRFSGQAKILSGSASAYLRATDGTISHDSFHSSQTDWTYLSVTFTTATNSAGLKLKINLDPNSASPSSLLWDTIRLERILPMTISFTSPATVSADEPFFVPFTIEHASPAAKYFFKGVSGTSVATFNTSWLAWNASWASMPSLVIDSAGSASAILQTRFNSSAAALGQNDFLVRLRQEGTEENIDASPLAILVVAPSVTANFAPTLDFSLPKSAIVGSGFDVSVKLSHLPANTAYYLKSRLGVDSSHLASGQTFNSEWLGDTDSWTKFPKITTNTEGTWEGKITARLADSKPSGTYQLELRVRQTDDDQNLDSDLQEMIFDPAPIVATPFATATAAVKLDLPEVFGVATGAATISAAVGEPWKPGGSSKSLVNNDHFDFSGDGLISLGMTLFGSALTAAFFRRSQFAV